MKGGGLLKKASWAFRTFLVCPREPSWYVPENLPGTSQRSQRRQAAAGQQTGASVLSLLSLVLSSDSG